MSFSWTKHCMTVFRLCKQGLAATYLIAHLACNAPTNITVNASYLAVGGVLEQFFE